MEFPSSRYGVTKKVKACSHYYDDPVTEIKKEHQNICLFKEVNLSQKQYFALLDGNEVLITKEYHSLYRFLSLDCFFTSDEKLYKELISKGFSNPIENKYLEIKKHAEIIDQYSDQELSELETYLKIRNPNLVQDFKELQKKHVINDAFLKRNGLSGLASSELKYKKICIEKFVSLFSDDAHNHAIFPLAFPNLAKFSKKPTQNSLDFLKNYVKMIETQKTTI